MDVLYDADVVTLNNKTIEIMSKLASVAATNKRKKKTNKNNWFDWECRIAKRNLCKLSKLYGKKPLNNSLRTKFYTNKKNYKTLIKEKKKHFLLDLDTKINSVKNIDWNAFNRLQKQHRDDETFDVHDLQMFYEFFKNLYNRPCSSEAHLSDIFVQRDRDSNVDSSIITESINNLNADFTLQELGVCVNKLKINKSVSSDLVSNEMIKYTTGSMRLIILKLFNSCLQRGIYPCNESLTTPIHKKGDKSNADNYRAIAVGSCLGKLFSSLLLNRMIQFRKVRCPDFPNQLGFCAGAQCSDHILTLKTLIDKYTSNKGGRLFACFVDYRKAFDSVCREALLYKLSQLGFEGNFFNCLNYMYSHSTTRIKLIKKVSAAMDVVTGTEQGHPMSPELFKMFIYDLSTELELLLDISIPDLNNHKISHLLWADDLILLAEDERSLQKLLDILSDFIRRWELSINITKTNIMVFNKSGRILSSIAVMGLPYVIGILNLLRATATWVSCSA